MPTKKVRGNGQGCAYKSPNGKSWTAQAVIDYRPSKKEGGQPVPVKRKKSGFATKRDALNYIETLKAGGIEKAKVAPRLSEYWKNYSENAMLKIGKDKQYAYKAAWERLKPIHDARIDTLTVDILQKTVSTVANTYYTQKDCRTVLKKLYERAHSEGYVHAILSDYIEIVPLEEKEQIPFNAEEQKALWKLYENGNIDAGIPLLMIYTGMMPGEAMLLKTEHIDLANKTMYGMNLKTKVRKKTPVVLADCIIPVVEDLIANAMPSGYIWMHNQDRWYARYYAVIEAAGCRKLPPYSCRHTTATALAIDAKIAPQTIKRVMRWTTTKMLDRYVHPGMDDALDAVNKIKKDNVLQENTD
jgi:integrase